MVIKHRKYWETISVPYFLRSGLIRWYRVSEALLYKQQGPLREHLCSLDVRGEFTDPDMRKLFDLNSKRKSKWRHHAYFQDLPSPYVEPYFACTDINQNSNKCQKY